MYISASTSISNIYIHIIRCIYIFIYTPIISVYLYVYIHMNLYLSIFIYCMYIIANHITHDIYTSSSPVPVDIFVAPQTSMLHEQSGSLAKLFEKAMERWWNSENTQPNGKLSREMMINHYFNGEDAWTWGFDQDPWQKIAYDRIAWPSVVLHLRLKNLGRGLNVKQSLGFQCGTDPTGIPMIPVFHCLYCFSTESKNGGLQGPKL